MVFGMGFGTGFHMGLNMGFGMGFGMGSIKTNTFWGTTRSRKKTGRLETGLPIMTRRELPPGKGPDDCSLTKNGCWGKRKS